MRSFPISALGVSRCDDNGKPDKKSDKWRVADERIRTDA